jgi:hypothetical protein
LLNFSSHKIYLISQILSFHFSFSFFCNLIRLSLLIIFGSFNIFSNSVLSLGSKLSIFKISVSIFEIISFLTFFASSHFNTSLVFFFIFSFTLSFVKPKNHKINNIIAAKKPQIHHFSFNSFREVIKSIIHLDFFIVSTPDFVSSLAFLVTCSTSSFHSFTISEFDTLSSVFSPVSIRLLNIASAFSQSIFP